jgi:hypothetical protein
MPELLAAFQTFQPPEQGSSLDQERLAGLVPPEPVHEFDRSPTLNAECLLETTPVQNR